MIIVYDATAAAIALRRHTPHTARHDELYLR